ncbi:MAG: HipA N-terminal domain-containing protein [Pseudomonadota bacterium]
MKTMPADNINPPSEYTLLIHLAEQHIGTLTLDKGANLLKLEYEPGWQQTGFPVLPALTLDNVHSPEIAYNYLDNALPEGKARKLLSEHLGVSEKNVYSQVRSIGHDLANKVIDTLTQQQFIDTITQEPNFIDDDRSYMAKVKEHILTRTQHLRSQAPEIPDIEV